MGELSGLLGKEIDAPVKTAVTIESSELVYSTDVGRIKPSSKQTVLTPNDGFAKIRRETKGRKGKGVITISGLGLTTEQLKTLASKIKKSCGAGGSVVGETIEVQGDKREAIAKLLEQAGFKIKFIGG